MPSDEDIEINSFPFLSCSGIVNDLAEKRCLINHPCITDTNYVEVIRHYHRYKLYALLIPELKNDLVIPLMHLSVLSIDFQGIFSWISLKCLLSVLCHQ